MTQALKVYLYIRFFRFITIRQIEADLQINAGYSIISKVKELAKLNGEKLLSDWDMDLATGKTWKIYWLKGE